MDAATIAITSVALSIDSMAVAIAVGASVLGRKLYSSIKIGLFFGFFQSLMMVIGWGAGSGISAFISALDHWVAFMLLLFVGIKMLIEGAKPDRAGGKGNAMPNGRLIALSVATSLDALAVGLSFSLIDGQILLPAASVGAVCFILSSLGAFASVNLTVHFADRAKVIGGLVLIGIGIRIVLEHMLGG